MSDRAPLPRKEILAEVELLLKRISSRLSKSMLLAANKKRPTLPQPKSVTGGELKDYQLQSLAWMVELANNGMSGILADDMGLGKTIQAITYMSHVCDAKGLKGKHLIVVPKNVLNNWKREFAHWSPKFEVIILPGTEAERQEVYEKYIKKSNFDVLITTYQAVQTMETRLKRFYWQTLIVDEAHSIKNSETCLAECLRRYKYKFALLLTGTPLSNELKELWSLLNFVAPDIFSDDRLFARIEESVNASSTNEDEKIKYQSEIAGKFKAIISPFMLRRVKSQINLGLKEKREITLFVSLTDLQLKMYRNYLKTRSVYGDEKARMMGPQVQLRKICAHPYLFHDIQDPKAPPLGEHLIEVCGKLKLLDKLLAKLLKQNHKVLIFSQFVTQIKILQDYCIYRDYKYSCLTGQNSLEERDEAVEQFSKSKDNNIFLISTRAGGIGLNLVAADVVVIYDMDWNPQMDKQAMDRAYRIGQKNNVLVFKLVTNNTVEERILEAQKYKLIWDELVIQKGGMARLKNAEEKYDKLDYNKVALLGAEEIFKLQQNCDDNTIEQIIKMGEEKDQKKTSQIREKLQKQFAKIGDIANPYEALEKQNPSLDKIVFEPHKIGKQNQLESKRIKNGSNVHRLDFIEPKDYHFFSDKRRAGKLLYELEAVENEDEKKDRIKELNELGFYSWTNAQYQAFVSAHEKYLRTEYSQIAKEIQTKTAEEVKQYSQRFFTVAKNWGKCSIDYKKVTKAQKQLETELEFRQSEKQILDCPDELFNLPQKPSLQGINKDTLTRIYFNDVKNNGRVSYQNYSALMEALNPLAVGRFEKLTGKQSKINLYKKTAKLLTVDQQEIREKMEERYRQVEKINGLGSEKKPSKHKKVQEASQKEEEDSMRTQLKI